MAEVRRQIRTSGATFGSTPKGCSYLILCYFYEENQNNLNTHPQIKPISKIIKNTD